MLKVWNVSLVLATGILCVLGTFLVRSGILDSIHAFGASTLGVPFVTLIACMSLGSIALVVWRRGLLRSEHRLDSLLSREAIFLLNNLVLVALCFVVFWGTFFPLISEAITGTQTAVGPPWFSRYTVPLALLLVLLSGIGPLIAWRRATPRNLRKTFAVPALFGVVAFLALLFVPGVPQKPLALAMFALGAFVIGTISQEVWRGTSARRAMSGEPAPVAVVSLVRRNRRRYGGYFVHLGIVFMFVGVAASTAFQHAEDRRMQVGQTTTVNGYQVKYVRSTATFRKDPNDTGAMLTLGAVLDVSKNGKHVATLQPARGYYPSTDASQGVFNQLINGEPTSEVALKTSPLRDFWTAVSPDFTQMQPMVDAINKAIPADLPQDKMIRGLSAGLTAMVGRYQVAPPPAMFRIISSPLVMWIWIGALVSIGGALIALWPAPDAARRRATAAMRARVAQDLGRA
jgi:cytochrome c-type biogenesis protein CcmF